MQELTQEQAERCARVCGWRREMTPHKYQWAPGHDAVTESWWSCNGIWQGVDPHPKYLDPYFWFPRLWEKLKLLSYDCNLGWNRDGQCLVNGLSQGIRLRYPINFIETEADEVTTLCAAIEALEKEKKV